MKKVILTFLIFLFAQASYACMSEKECIISALETRKDFKTALNYLDKALEFNKDSEQAYYFRALLKFENGKRKAALADYDKLITKYPNNWLYYFNRGYVCYSLGQIYLKCSVASFESAYKLNPDATVAKVNYGVSKEASDTYSETVAMFGLIAGAVASKNRRPVENIKFDLWRIFEKKEDIAVENPENEVVLESDKLQNDY